MVTLRQDSRGNYSARKRLPDDVREDYGRLYGAHHEAKFSKPASLGKQIAQQKFHQWATEVEQRIEAIRKAQRGEGMDLNREQAAALAGEWYLWFVGKYDNEDADPEAYEEALWDIIHEMREFAPDEVREEPLRDMRWARDVPRRKQHRPRYFYEHEYRTILKAASAINDTSNPDKAAQRWVPWLLAYTGARPGEITQLRGSNVEHIDGIWTIHITPEAGTVKGGIARRVPLHPHLIEQGFLKFVQPAGNGPLFYRLRKRREDTVGLIKQRKSPGAQVRQRLAAWVREIGVKDKHLSPNHAWRHTFKHIGRRFERNDTLLDYICGHVPATVGRSYGEPALKDMARVIERFPRYET